MCIDKSDDKVISKICLSKLVSPHSIRGTTSDGTVLSQTDGENTYVFRYDENGSPLGFVYNGTPYWYLTNISGDVVAVTDANGKLIYQYYYDEWGEPLAEVPESDITEEQKQAAKNNPLRYRGYYYDLETGYYYLQSRYYDPTICRFINADSYEEAKQCKNICNGLNIFIYCSNDPCNGKDESGCGRKWVGFIVYSNPGSDFIKQAKLMMRKKAIKKYNLVIFYVVKASTFVRAWNIIADNYKLKHLFLYIHGEPGALCFKNSKIMKKNDKYVTNKFSELKKLDITGKIYLNSCNGGTAYKGGSAAALLSKKVPGQRVRAVSDGNVYYPGFKQIVISGVPYTRGKGRWYDFIYKYDKKLKKRRVYKINEQRKWSF